ncbi:MAG TPA: hypothetical protein PKD55_05760 [Bellilinea sp.]|nr:hypothetical protein [Bellilinea sp.]
MRRLLPLLLLALIVSACVPADPLSSYDPYRAAAVADAAIVATQQARARQMEQATLQAAQQRQETDLKVTAIAAEIQGTQAAWSFQITQAAATSQAGLATAQAARVTEAAAQTATPAAATAAAIMRADAREATQQASRIAAAEIANTTWPLLKFAGVIMLLILAWVVIRDIVNWKVVWPHRVHETKWGVVMHYQLPSGQIGSRFVPRPLLADRAGRSYSDPVIDAYQDAYPVTDSGSVWASSPGASEREAALRLIEAAISVHPDHELGRTLPRWDRLDGYSSGVWQRIANWLEGEGLVVKQQGRETRLPVLTLGELQYHLMADSPTLSEDDGE